MNTTPFEINPLTGAPLTNGELHEITVLAKRQLLLQSDKEELEKKLEATTEDLNRVSQQLLPEAMLAVGMSQFKLATGESVTISKFYSAKIPEDQQIVAFNWLRKNGHDSLIKREVKCIFGKGEDADAQIAVQALHDLGHTPIDKTSVHPQTLKAFVREQMESTASTFPAELFGAYVGNQTKIVPVKK